MQQRTAYGISCAGHIGISDENWIENAVCAELRYLGQYWGQLYVDVPISVAVRSTA